MKIQNIPVGPIGTNCYIIYDEDSKTCAIVDPGFNAEKILNNIEKGYKATHILITHPHYDHISACEAVKLATGAIVYIHEKAADILSNNDLNCTHTFTRRDPGKFTFDKTIKEGDIINIGTTPVKVLYTPGHCEGSCCFIAGDYIMSGDLLFLLNIGRTDFPTGDYNILQESLKKLEALGKDYKILPGHGEATTLKFEIENNPYFGKVIYDFDY